MSDAPQKPSSLESSAAERLSSAELLRSPDTTEAKSEGGTVKCRLCAFRVEVVTVLNVLGGLRDER